MKFLSSIVFISKPFCLRKRCKRPLKDVLGRESFKLVPSFFLKLSFFCVFEADFCCPPRSSGLAPNKGHEKRWVLGMARLLHGRTGHWWLANTFLLLSSGAYDRANETSVSHHPY